ncbi:Thymidylate synthase [compost metagenome]
MGKIFSGENPSQLYLDALLALLREGKERTPRGKKTKELRPVIFEYTNPRNRLTFLRGRRINPFFQAAEALWILAGRSDVPWLANYNKSIAQFSDDGQFFNAPYGERLRYWGKNDARNFIFNPLDQLEDCYLKLKEDPDTRQAVAFIGDPRFDNYAYTNIQKGKDIACNLNIKFKIEDGKLDISVDNRSNDLHWGVFGANLVQFSTIQEVMASWLGIGVGTYYQITDSLHVYLEDYGAKETDKILKGADIDSVHIHNPHLSVSAPAFTFPNEPRMVLGFGEFESFLEQTFDLIDIYLHDDNLMSSEEGVPTVLSLIHNAPDPYFRNTLMSMAAYRSHRLGNSSGMIEALRLMVESQLKLSCLAFLYPSYKDSDAFSAVYDKEVYTPEMVSYIKGE